MARRGQEHWEDKEVSRVRVYAVVKETGNTVKITWAKKRRNTLNNCQNKDPFGCTIWSTLDQKTSDNGLFSRRIFELPLGFDVVFGQRVLFQTATS